MNASIICGLNAGVQYAQLQWPQFECQSTAQVSEGCGSANLSLVAREYLNTRMLNLILVKRDPVISEAPPVS